MSSPEAANTCPGDDLLLRFVSGQASREEVARMEAHLDRCQACLSLVLAAAVPEAPGAPPPQIEEFRLLRPLGQGAMGQVFLAEDTLLGRRVALKLLSLAESPAAKERFALEGRAIARLRHPNIVVIHRIGACQGRPFLVTELLDGQSLAALPRPLPPDTVVRYGRQLASALAAAHREGVLHRDIKPANVMVTEEGVLKLLDFGLAKLGEAALEPTLPADASASSRLELGLTAPGTLLGTPLYMAPELFTGAAASRASDVYALGALLYELCGGHPPHRAESVGALRLQVQEVEPAPLPADVPEGLRAIISRSLSKLPEARYPSAHELSLALAALPDGAEGARRDAPRPPRRWPRRWLLLLVLLAPLLLLGLLAQRTGGLRGPFTAEDRLLIPGGALTMGSPNSEIEEAFAFCQRLGISCRREIYEREQPVRAVRLSSFWMDRVEVTNRRYAEWLRRLPGLRLQFDRLAYDGAVLLADIYPGTEYSGLQVRGGKVEVRRGFEDRPVVLVTWEGARRYCQSRGGDLPTEAQWEMAARGAEGARFPWGDELPRCDGTVFGRTGGKACAGVGLGPAVVGTASQDRTPLGVLDLGGNVAEWVRDGFLPRYPDCAPPCLDPVVVSAPAEGDGDGRDEPRGVRGGAWWRAAEASRAAGRSRALSRKVNGDIGFRCVQMPR